VTSLVCADQSGRPGDRASGGPIAISGDGRFVCFSSNAITLVPNDTNGQNDIFVRDRRLGRTERVNVSSTGAQANGTSLALAISADGRYVAFESNAGNLVPGDGNGEWDIFVHDRQTRTTTVESLTMGGGPAGVSRHPAISGDGRFVAFYSESTYLVPNDTNGVGDVFLRDRQTGVTTRVSVDSSGVQGNDRSDLPLLNQDGSVVAFASRATNLVLLDGNGRQDAFLHYPLLGFTTRVSLDWQGLEAQGGDSYATGLSADGLAVVMVSSATRLVPDDGNGTNDVFLRHVTSGAFERISVNEGFGDSRGRSEQPSVSADGRYVAFTSNASNLVADDTNGFWDTFLVDRTLRTITRVSLDSGGGQIGALASNFPMTLALSGDGRVVAFQTDSPDVVRPDPNGTSDVFAREAFPVLSTVDRPRPGTTATLALAAPWDPGRGFAAAASLGFEPGLPLDVRRIPQQLDALFVVSQLATTVFEGFRGVLDGAGRAALRVHVPVDPALAGLRFYVAALVLDPAAPSGVRGLTNALPVTIVP
jgi:Tol biopolymer transport system component